MEDQNSNPDKEEIHRIRVFYQRKLEDLARKCEARVKSAKQVGNEKSLATSLTEVEQLRAENEVLRIRLQEVFPNERWMLHEVIDLVELKKQAAAAEKHRVAARRQAVLVRKLTKQNEELTIQVS